MKFRRCCAMGIVFKNGKTKLYSGERKRRLFYRRGYSIFYICIPVCGCESEI